MAPKLTLHHYWRSSCSWRLRWALALKQLPYTSVTVNLLTGENFKPDFLALNPAGFLPVLSIDGQPFSESLALMEWLDDIEKTPPLLPTAPLDRLLARALALTIAAGTQPLQNPWTIKQLIPVESERKPVIQGFIKRGLGIFAGQLTMAKKTKGPYCLGDQVTVADLCLIPQVYNARRFEVDLTGLERLSEIYEHCLTTDACLKAAPQNQPGATA